MKIGKDKKELPKTVDALVKELNDFYDSDTGIYGLKSKPCEMTPSFLVFNMGKRTICSNDRYRQCDNVVVARFQQGYHIPEPALSRFFAILAKYNYELLDINFNTHELFFAPDP